MNRIWFDWHTQGHRKFWYDRLPDYQEGVEGVVKIKIDPADRAGIFIIYAENCAIKIYGIPYVMNVEYDIDL